MKIRKLGLIAGSGQFPLLALREAVRQDIPVVVAAIRGETLPEIENFASCSGVSVQWLKLGQLGKLIRLFAGSGVDQAMMAGQVKHVRIFSRAGLTSLKEGVIVPDLKMIRLLASLPQKNTRSLIESIIQTLENEGIRFLDSTVLLESLLPRAGVLTCRRPNSEEGRDIEYGRPIAKEIARLDLGQTIVVKDQAVVAVEAMEGTDETIRRAARLVRGQRLTAIKVSRPRQDMRFDVPVIGLQTLKVLQECQVSALSIDAGRTLMLDREALLEEAERLQITIVAD